MEALTKREQVEIAGTVTKVLVMDTIRNYAIIVLRSNNIPDFVKDSSGYEDTFVAAGNFARVTADQISCRGSW